MNKILRAYNKTNAFGRLFGMDYKILSPTTIEYQLTVDEKFLATPTAMHGGALAGMMDAILGVASLNVSSKRGKVVSTIEFKINYLKPVFLGDELRGVGTVLSEGNRIIITKGEIFNQRNELVAIATATLNAYPWEKSDFYSEG